MTEEEHLLVCLVEECTEISEQCLRISQAACKLLRFGKQDINPETMNTALRQLALEIADLAGVIEMLEERQIITREQIDAKKIKVAKFMKYARNLVALS